MTALLDSAALDQAGDTGTTLVRLLRAEFMKLRTTSAGWLFLTGFIMFTALALTLNGFGITLCFTRSRASSARRRPSCRRRMPVHPRAWLLWPPA